MATASELGVQLTEARKGHQTWLAPFKQSDGSYDLKGDDIAEFHKRNAELGIKQTEYETALAVEKSAAENEAKLAPQGTIAGRPAPGERPESKDVSSRIRTKDAMDVAFKGALEKNSTDLDRLSKGGRGSVSFDLDMDFKTLLQLSDISPQADRQPIQASAQFLASVEDLFMPGTTDSKSVDYYIETTYTDNSAAVADGSAATDSALDFTLTTDAVEEHQAWIPVTRATLADNAGLQSFVEGRLAHQMATLVSSKLMAGDGTSPNISGILDRSGLQTQAKGADPAFDAIMKAITLVEVTGDSTADAIVIHPTDWQNLRLTRTTDGLYILGNPTDSGPSQLWGVPVRRSTSAGAAGTAVVGAFRSQAQIFNRQGLTVEISTEHSTYFTERKVAIALLRRLALAVYRPSGFAKVTGL